MAPKITACPRCGGTRISAGRMGSGVLFGITSWKEECRNCGYQGSPVVFDSKEDYLKFVRLLKKKKPQEKSSSEEKPVEEDAMNDLSDSEKEVVNFLKELESECTESTQTASSWHQGKSWWPEFLVAMVLSVISVPHNFFQYAAWLGVEISVVFSVLFFVLNVVSFLVIIVIVEYFVHVVRSYLHHT